MNQRTIRLTCNYPNRLKQRQLYTFFPRKKFLLGQGMNTILVLLNTKDDLARCRAYHVGVLRVNIPVAFGHSLGLVCIMLKINRQKEFVINYKVGVA